MTGLFSLQVDLVVVSDNEDYGDDFAFSKDDIFAFVREEEPVRFGGMVVNRIFSPRPSDPSKARICINMNPGRAFELKPGKLIGTAELLKENFNPTKKFLKIAGTIKNTIHAIVSDFVLDHFLNRRE